MNTLLLDLRRHRQRPATLRTISHIQRNPSRSYRKDIFVVAWLLLLPIPHSMPTIAGSQVFPPKAEDEFEDISLSAAKLRWQGSAFFRNGRRGQAQKGVDIFGQVNNQMIGIQCKNTVGGVSEKTVLEEVRNAESFVPPLAALYIATTAKRDENLQEKIRILSADRAAEQKFPVHLLFWDDIVFDLAKDKDEFFKHYPDSRISRPAEPTSHHNGQQIFDIDDLAVERHPAALGRKIRRATLSSIGGWTALAGGTALIYTVLASFLGKPSNWSFAAMMLFVVGMTFLVMSSVLKRRKFEHLLLGRYYMELSASDNLHINRLTATCPWCAAQMYLRHVGPKDGPKKDIFICERNFEQHTIILDHTALPELP